MQKGPASSPCGNISSGDSGDTRLASADDRPKAIQRLVAQWAIEHTYPTAAQQRQEVQARETHGESPNNPNMTSLFNLAENGGEGGIVRLLLLSL